MTVHIHKVCARGGSDGGLAAAQFLLGTRYAGSAGTERDDHKAMLWLLKASEQGHPKAFFRLGKLVAANRHGVARDLEEALFWYRKAAPQSFAPSRVALEFLEATHAQACAVTRLLCDPGCSIPWLAVNALQPVSRGTAGTRVGQAGR